MLSYQVDVNILNTLSIILKKPHFLFEKEAVFGDCDSGGYICGGGNQHNIFY